MEKLKVGFGRVDITPEKFGPMGGFGNDNHRICTQVWDHLYGTCIAISDEQDETMLLITMDILHTNNDQTIACREAITAATGVPGNRIMTAATHNHSGPSINGDSEFTEKYYIPFLVQQMAKAAVDAMADRRDAQIMIGQKETDRLTFIRHYIDENDRLYNGPWPAQGKVTHDGEADQQLQLIRFVRADAPDIIMANFQAHLTIVGGNDWDTEMSADFVGVMRTEIEDRTGCYFAYFQGACGNQGPTSKFRGEAPLPRMVHKWALRYIHHGMLMAAAVQEGLKDLRPAKGGPIRSKQLQYPAPIDHSQDHLGEGAKIICENYYKLETEEEKKALLEKYGLSSRLHAGNVYSRYRADKFVNMEINALSAGDISFATAPYEMFSSNGRYIKENSPFPMTFVMGYCNGSYSYLADKAAFRHGDRCYEVYSRRYEEGTAEAIVATHVEMLKELKN